MQILHLSLSQPQTGSTFDNLPVSLLKSSSNHRVLDSSDKFLNTPSTKHSTILTKFLSQRTWMDIKISLPNYINNNSGKDMMEIDYPRNQIPHDVLITAGDGRRNNPSGDGNRPPGDHYKDTDKRVQKRKRESIEDEVEDDECDEDDYLIDGNGYRFEHSEKAYLIVNLYSREREGYTFTAYLPETAEEEARMFEESHLIPYSEPYLLDCINNECVPLRLVAKLEREHGVDLIRYRNCVVCQVRDFRRFSTSATQGNQPICRQVVLKPTTLTLLSDLEQLIAKSFDDRVVYKKILQTKNPESELIPFKRMRLSHLNYPFDCYENKDRFEETEEPDDLSLDQRHELEKKIIRETAGGLCLDPSKQVGLIANAAQYERFKWNTNKLKKTVQLYTTKKSKVETTRNSVIGIGIGVPISSEDEEEVMPEDENTVLIAAVSILDKESEKNDFPLFKFIRKCIEKKKLQRQIDVETPEERIRLPPIKFMDYYPGPDLTSFEDIRPLCQPAEPATLRPVFGDNFIAKTEEYLFETERRKHPHRTKLTIFQRNGVDNYFGELEQEAFIEDSTPTTHEQQFITSGNARVSVPVKPYVLDPPNGSISGSKCQFDLGSIDSVNLYVKQFTDIFTEDGRRPCKITYHKAGQAGPTTLYTSSYKSLVNGSNINLTTGTPPTVSNLMSQTTNGPSHVVIAHQTPPPSSVHNNINTIIVSVPSIQGQNQPPSTISIPVVNPISVPPPSLPLTSSSSPSQTNPPVQIVHPQPRPQPNLPISSSALSQLIQSDQGIMTNSTLTSSNSNLLPGSTIQTGHSASTNLNLNLHVNSTRVVQQRHQLLTRPQIYNVNLNQSQTQAQRPTSLQAPQLIQSHPQHHHQQGIRVKQPTLATLLLTGLPNSVSKPITVAIQPQPQNQGLTQLNPNQINLNQVQAITLNAGSLDSHHTLGHQSQQVQITHAQHGHSGNQTTNNNPIMIMVSPATGTSLGSQNTMSSGHHTISHHHTGNVSLNLNTINLEGLLAVSSNGVTTLQQQQPSYVTSTALVSSSSGSTNSMGLPVSNTLNILRLSNNNSSLTLQPQHMIRQSGMGMMSPLEQNSTSIATGISTTTGTTRLQRQPPELEEITVPDLNTLLNNGCGNNRVVSNYTRTHPKGPSIDLNLNVNLNLSGSTAVHASTPRSIVGTHSSSTNDIFNTVTQNGGVVNVNSVDSIFNALSEAIGPELEQKLEHSMVQSTTHMSSSLSPSTSHPPKSTTTILTLNDLLGSPPMSGSSGSNINVLNNLNNLNHIVSSPMQSPQSPSISSILSPISQNVGGTSSSIAYTTPRLSALLAGTPSADSSNNLVIDSSSQNPRSGIGSANYGNLLDRLMSQGQTPTTMTQRSQTGSRLNPIATATPNVVLDHPVLAATLTQGTNPNLRQALTRPTAYRQIAPAPPPTLQSSGTQSQQQPLINLLGFMGTNNSGSGVVNGGTPAQTIRISTTNNSGSGGNGNSGSR